MDYLSYLKEQELESEPKPKKQDLWALLSTMKFAIWILIILGIMSLISMFVGELWNPEKMAEQGVKTSLDPLLQAFQMDNPFRSWWYKLLLAALNLSLFACILKRTPQIWKLWTSTPPMLKETRNSQSERIINRQVTAPRERLLERLGSAWSYRIKTDEVWVGEKSRSGMWGPLLTHLGMLLIGIGALIGSFGGISLRAGGFKGDVVEVEGMPFAVQIDSFRISYYPLQPGQWVLVDDEWIGRLAEKHSNGSWLVEKPNQNEEEPDLTTVDADKIKNHFNSDMDRGNISRYSSFVTVLENNKPLYSTEIAVNSPLRHQGFRLYQSSYDPENPRVDASYKSVSLSVRDSSNQVLQTLTLRPDVETAVPNDTLMVKVGRLLPNFKIGSDFKPYSASAEFVNPAVELTFRGPKGFTKSQWAFLKFQSHDNGPGKFNYGINTVDGEQVSSEMRTIWEVKKTHGMEFLWAGFIICSLGLLLCFYVTHRILYIYWPTQERQETLLTGLSRRTPHLFAREVDHIIENIHQ